MLDPDRRHLIAYVAAAAVLVVMAMRLVGGDRGSGAPSVSVAAPARAPAAPRREALAKTPLIWVHVAGAVRNPGLYSLPKGARVAAAIQRAGGVRRRADRAAVNLAAKVVDGQQVFVPAQAAGSRAAGASAGAGSPGVAAGGSGAGGGALGSAGAASGAAGAPAASAPVSLSNATQAQLETLDGIGPALALRIIEYRDQNGGFRSIDQLREVSGIGDKRFAALKDSIVP